ncbi:uncharacterized protein LOC144605256 [Rhinoraja longicauda]
MYWFTTIYWLHYEEHIPMKIQHRQTLKENDHMIHEICWCNKIQRLQKVVDIAQSIMGNDILIVEKKHCLKKILDQHCNLSYHDQHQKILHEGEPSESIQLDGVLKTFKGQLTGGFADTFNLSLLRVRLAVQKSHAMDPAEKALHQLLQVSPARAEVECGQLAKELVEASLGLKLVDGTFPGPAVPLVTEDLRREIANVVNKVDIASPKDAIRVINKVAPHVFEEGQKRLGRVLTFLVMVVAVVQRVAPQRPSEEEVSLMSDCLAKCLSHHSQAWLHQQDVKRGALTIITSGLLRMAGALIGTILWQ